MSTPHSSLPLSLSGWPRSSLILSLYLSSSMSSFALTSSFPIYLISSEKAFTALTKLFCTFPFFIVSCISESELIYTHIKVKITILTKAIQCAFILCNMLPSIYYHFFDDFERCMFSYSRFSEFNFACIKQFFPKLLSKYLFCQ